MGQEHHYDQCLVNGHAEFGRIPGGLVGACPYEAPIYLFRGNLEWGWMHIQNKHERQPLFSFSHSVEATVWTKCGDRGNIHSSRDPGGLTISITVAPTAFLVLTYQPAFDAFSITTMFSKRKPNPEPIIADYVGAPRPTSRPVCGWLPYK